MNSLAYILIGWSGNQNLVAAGVDKLFSRRPIFKIFICAPDQAGKKVVAPNQSARPIVTQLQTLLFALYYLNNTYNFHI